ncbi:MAG: hypothetical protein ABIJ27_00560 [Candidatus Omnitrophota bacterium]
MKRRVPLKKLDHGFVSVHELSGFTRAYSGDPTGSKRSVLMPVRTEKLYR